MTMMSQLVPVIYGGSTKLFFQTVGLHKLSQLGDISTDLVKMYNLHEEAVILQNGNEL